MLRRHTVFGTCRDTLHTHFNIDLNWVLYLLGGTNNKYNRWTDKLIIEQTNIQIAQKFEFNF